MIPMSVERRRAWDRLEGVQWHVGGSAIDRALLLAEETERRASHARRWKMLAHAYRRLLNARGEQ